MAREEIIEKLNMKPYIWLSFTILFAVLAIYHFCKAEQKIGHFDNKGKIIAINIVRHLFEVIKNGGDRKPHHFL